MSLLPPFYAPIGQRSVQRWAEESISVFWEQQLEAFLPSSFHPLLIQRQNLFFKYPWVKFPPLKWRHTPQPDWGLSMPPKSIRPPTLPSILLSNFGFRPRSLDPTQSSLVLPLHVHHSLSPAPGACLAIGHDRGYTHTVINTVCTTVLQVHQLASNNDLTPIGGSWRARRSRSRPPDNQPCLCVSAGVHRRLFEYLSSCSLTTLSMNQLLLLGGETAFYSYFTLQSTTSGKVIAKQATNILYNSHNQATTKKGSSWQQIIPDWVALCS